MCSGNIFLKAVLRFVNDVGVCLETLKISLYINLSKILEKLMKMEVSR